jgi:hypothetical protein
MPSITEIISKKIGDMPAGSVFDYAQLDIASDKFVTAAQTLSRLSRKGVISRLSKGKYFKPNQSKFGNSRPKESAIVGSLTMKQNRRIGYLTGLTVYNHLGLTTQVSNTLVIATSSPLLPKKFEGYNVKYVKRNVSFLDEDIPLLQLLDALRDIKTIPDSNPDDSFKTLKGHIASLSNIKKERLVSLALSFNPGTRALLGALIENYFQGVSVSKLKQSINRLSSFETGVSSELLPNKQSWNLI